MKTSRGFEMESGVSVDCFIPSFNFQHIFTVYKYTLPIPCAGAVLSISATVKKYMSLFSWDVRSNK